MKNEKKEKTLYIFSYGLRPSQITLETLSALKKCDLVFSHSLEGGAGDFISGACKEFRMLRGLNQRQIAGSVRQAFRTRGTVGFLTYGNPFFLNATTALINAEMKRAGVCVRVMPAVSSFDDIINLLDLNKYSTSGLRLVDAAVVMEDIPLTPEMDTLFFVIGVLNLKENSRHREKFFKKLSKIYPGAQAAVLVNCACIGDESGRLIRTSVARLKKAFNKVDKVTTLFIPAAANNAEGKKAAISFRQ
jgi:uncharacterized protein YabN with tetrapyrrole methylase and pyrophosphatase domain